MPRTSIIFCNGEPGKFAFKLTKQFHDAIIICTDGASDYTFKHKIIPNYIVGDLDSISPSILLNYKKLKVTIKKISEQHHNDLEKAINLALHLKSERIIIAGYSGKRSDHHLNNFSILIKYSGRYKIIFIDDIFEIFIISRKTEFNYQPDETISLFGFPFAEGITSSGLKYKLKNEKLIFGKREGALNKSTGKKIIIRLKKGNLLVFKKHFGKSGNLFNAI